MTEREWWQATDARLMLDPIFLMGKISERKLRLFEVAAYDVRGQGGQQEWEAEMQARAALLRDLCISITFDPSWLTWHDGLLVSMAQRMYDSRDFSDMPVLADALEEAGCQDQDILGHCRSGEQHVRGCWVVDLLLGKE
jgi:hypothetical protein